MAEKLNLYRCEICGNIVEVVIDGAGTLVCCGEDMKLLEPGTNDNGALEKHVPVVEHMGSTHVIKVGSTPHPMEKEHYIQFIEVISNDRRYVKRKYLYPNEEPEMIIKCLEEDNFEARELCNIHGLFSNKEENNGQ